MDTWGSPGYTFLPGMCSLSSLSNLKVSACDYKQIFEIWSFLPDAKKLIHCTKPKLSSAISFKLIHLREKTSISVNCWRRRSLFWVPMSKHYSSHQYQSLCVWIAWDKSCSFMPYMDRRPLNHLKSKSRNAIMINSRVWRNGCGKKTSDSKRHLNRIQGRADGINWWYT